MPIQEPAARVSTPGKSVQTAMGKRPVGVMSNFDGNLSSNLQGKKNVRVADHIHYGEGEYNCYPHNDVEQTAEDPDAGVDGPHSFEM